MKSEQAEKRAMLKQDTYHSRAMRDHDASGGRFAVINQTEVTGTTPAAQYPAAAGPWSSDQVKVPDEPPLGYSVDDLEPTGEAFEVERSQQQEKP